MVCLTAVAALCAPGSALAGGKANSAVAPQVAATVEVAEPTVDTTSTFGWLANWTW